MEGMKELQNSFFELDKKISESLIEINAKFDIIHQDITNKANINTAEIRNMQEKDKQQDDRIKKLEDDLLTEKTETIKLQTTLVNFKYLTGFIGFIITCLTFAIRYLF